MCWDSPLRPCPLLAVSLSEGQQRDNSDVLGAVAPCMTEGTLRVCERSRRERVGHTLLRRNCVHYVFDFSVI